MTIEGLQVAKQYLSGNKKREPIWVSRRHYRKLFS